MTRRIGLINSYNLVILNFGTSNLISKPISAVTKKLECSQMSNFLGSNWIKNDIKLVA